MKPIKKGKRWIFQDWDSRGLFLRLLFNISMGNPFHFTRWGDGEFNCINGKQGTNCDGHEYFPEMGIRLQAILANRTLIEDPEFFFGAFPMAYSMNKEFMDSLNIEWDHGQCLMDAYLEGNLIKFCQVAHQKNRILLVANNNFVNIPGTKFWDGQVIIPKENAWNQYKSIRDKMLALITDFDVIYISAGMMSAILQEDIYNHDKETTTIDMGSLLDPFCGIISRSYQTA